MVATTQGPIDRRAVGLQQGRNEMGQSAKNAKGHRKHSPLSLEMEWLKLPLQYVQLARPRGPPQSENIPNYAFKSAQSFQS